MKNKLLTLAGVLALLAVIGKFYAGPAIAQTVRAALVQDRDSYPRQPFSIGLQNQQDFTIPPPPAGKRMVITSMSCNISASSIPVFETFGQSEGRYYFNEYVLAPGLSGEWIGKFAYNWVLDSDAAAYIEVIGPVVTGDLVYVTGYYIDVPLNAMKNKLLTSVGVLAVIGLLGKFYAVPAVAQAVEAALVQYRDSPPRQPFTIRSTLTPSLGTKFQPITFPAVPAGKRMIVTSVAGTVSIVLPSHRDVRHGDDNQYRVRVIPGTP